MSLEDRSDTVPLQIKGNSPLSSTGYLLLTGLGGKSSHQTRFYTFLL